MKIFLDLIGGIKGIIFISIIVILFGFVIVERNKFNDMKKNLSTVTTQRDQAAVERDKAILAAKNNQETIDELKQEKAGINKALNSLADAKVQNSQNAVTREIIIQGQSTIPANSAQTAPVLSSIITAVQDDRVRRRGQ